MRQNDYKLMLFWNAEGTVQRRELYRLDSDPREEGRDIAEQQPAKAGELQDLLLTYLKSVDAERVTDFRPRSRKKPKRT